MNMSEMKTDWYHFTPILCWQINLIYNFISIAIIYSYKMILRLFYLKLNTGINSSKSNQSTGTI